MGTHHGLFGNYLGEGEGDHVNVSPLAASVCSFQSKLEDPWLSHIELQSRSMKYIEDGL